MELYWPFDVSRVTEWPGGFSDIRYGVHMGTDFGVPQGTELRATVTGTVSAIYIDNGGGNGVDIRTDDGYVIRSWHLSEFRCERGQRLNAGDVFGLSGGAKGTWGAGNSTGPHLHWEIRNNSNFTQVGWFDPRPFNPLTFGQTPTKEDEDMKQISFNGRRYLISMGAIQSIPVGEDVGDIYGQPIELGTNFERGDAMNRICRAHGIPDWAWQQVGNGSDIAGNDHSWSAATGFYVTTAGPSNHPANVDMDAIKQAIKDAIGTVNVNVDAIADAIASKLDLTCDCGCGVPVPEPVPDTTTKAEILSAIETNYPEDK